jgi:nucleoside-diphosphate-sugar epimerase
VAAALVRAGHGVRALVRDPAKGERVLGPLGVASADLVPGDMTDGGAVDAAIAGCDAVVHAAAGVSVTTGASDFESNVRGTEVVLGAAVARALPSVYVSSLTAIMTPGRPTSEASEVTEGKTHYGRSKAKAERWVRARQDEGASIAIVYPPGVVGPDDPGFSESVKAYRTFLRGTLRSSGGNQLVDVRDLAQLVVRLLEAKHAGRVVAAGHFFTWDELTVLLERVTGARIGRIAAPGWLLRGFARGLDVVGRVTGRTMPMTGEGIEIATRWERVEDSPIVETLGVCWRPAEETLADLFRWYVEAGRLPASAVPGLTRDGAGIGS